VIEPTGTVYRTYRIVEAPHQHQDEEEMGIQEPMTGSGLHAEVP